MTPLDANDASQATIEPSPLLPFLMHSRLERESNKMEAKSSILEETIAHYRAIVGSINRISPTPVFRARERRSQKREARTQILLSI